MKTLRLFAALALFVATFCVAVKAVILGAPPLAAIGLSAGAFWIGCNMLDTNWTPRARCATNDISLTGLTELLYQARDQVQREPTGFIQGCTVNGGSEGVSLGGTVTSLRTQEPTAVTSYTPAMTVPNAADITTAAETMTIDGVAGADIPMKGEQFAQLAATVGVEVAIRQLYAQSIRKMVNLIETAAGLAIKKGSSRAVGTAGTTPFASNHNTINSLRQILEDNGAPVDDGDLSLIISTTAGTNLRNLTQLTKVNEAGSDNPLRRGELLNISGFSIRTSAGVSAHTKGTGASYQVNQSGLTNGSTTVTIDVGSGTVLAGDIITFASGTGSGHNYVVKTGAAAAGDIVLNHPGLRGNIADNNAITIGNDYTANLGFHKSAVEIAMRPPAQPPGGDIGEVIAVLTDEKTGLSFEARLYRGFGMNQIRLMCFYGIKVWKPEFVATLMG